MSADTVQLADFKLAYWPIGQLAHWPIGLLDSATYSANSAQLTYPANSAQLTYLL